MLMHTKRQVHKWKFLQHALSRYVYNHSLCVIIIIIIIVSIDDDDDDDDYYYYYYY